jgi:hypothetical protein
VQDEVLANTMSFARYLDLLLLITAFRDCRSAVATIEPGTFGNGFQFPQEVIFGIALLIHKDPALVRRVLPAFP